VTLVAIDHRVGTHQRKAVIVLLYISNRNLPAADSVALLAICSQLALVNVSMAILAVFSNVGENRPGMAFGTCNRPVQAAQRILRLIVIEFRNRANRPPRIGCVAILARNGEIAMRTVRSSSSLCADNTRTSGKPEKKDQNRTTNDPRNHGAAHCGRP